MTILSRKLAAEALGTAFLLAAIIGSGIMGERLASGNVALVLLANSLATGCALVALIHAFAPFPARTSTRRLRLPRRRPRICRGARPALTC